ncbi:MAG: 50S ribosomal protein L11 methyltransferase [Bacteroidota bacterium]|nr:50S ribosomal protein L11 methyltransferase [Bacteroidota bacterium]
MDYIELRSIVTPQIPFQDVFISELSEIGFESFVEENEYLLAYIPAKNFDINKIESICSHFTQKYLSVIKYGYNLIKSHNWNEEWEKNYEPVVIAGKCKIIAPFHNFDKNYQYNIIIGPQMSFGTGHHETTSLMIELILKLNFKDKKVIDIGSGTGVLGILAGKIEASSVLCIDNDENAISNAEENIERNFMKDKIIIKLVDSKYINKISEKFEYAFANINKNVIINDIGKYRNLLKNEGILLLSGFYDFDLKDIQNEAEKYDFILNEKIIKNHWIACSFKLKN